MHQLQNGISLKYNRAELLELQRDFDIPTSLKTQIHNIGIVINTDKPQKKASKGTKGRRKPKSNIDKQQRTHCNEPVLSPNDNHPIASGSQLRYEYPSLFYTNARSLNTTKKTDLEHYACSSKRDVIALTETWLNDKNEEYGHINNYNMFTAHRCNSRVGGGICVYGSALMNAIKIDGIVTKNNSAVWV